MLAGALLAAVESSDADGRSVALAGRGLLSGRGRKAGRRAGGDGEGARQTGAGET
jgi:hypothetical protein